MIIIIIIKIVTYILYLMLHYKLVFCRVRDIHFVDSPLYCADVQENGLNIRDVYQLHGPELSLEPDSCLSDKNPRLLLNPKFR
jgi:hypothetical protein